MKSCFAVVLVLASAMALGSLTGCGAAEGAADDLHDAADRANVAAGSWHGTWRDDHGRWGVARFDAVQDGLSIRGVVTFEDNPCFRTASASGALDAENLGVRVSLDFGDATLSYEASLTDGASLDGGFKAVAAAGECAGAYGQLALGK
jgi:hypothetical protein